MREPAAQTAGRSIVADTAHAPQNIYEICAYDGTPVALHVRIQSPGQKKRFVWQQPDGSSGLADRSVSELPLYGTEQLPDLKSGRLVVVTEGEKAADALRVRDIPAVGTVNYVERRTAEGRPKREIIRCPQTLSRPRDLSARDGRTTDRAKPQDLAA